MLFVLTLDYFTFNQVMNNIVQNLSESILHFLYHLKCSTNLSLQTYGLKHAKAHFWLLLWNVRLCGSIKKILFFKDLHICEVNYTKEFPETELDFCLI